MIDIEGTWTLKSYKGSHLSGDCTITFYEGGKVVFEETLDNGQYGRFWYYYEFDQKADALILTPIHKSLSNLFKGRVRTLNVQFMNNNFRIVHNSESYSEYQRANFVSNPPFEDKFPVKKGQS